MFIQVWARIKNFGLTIGSAFARQAFGALALISDFTRVALAVPPAMPACVCIHKCSASRHFLRKIGYYPPTHPQMKTFHSDKNVSNYGQFLNVK